MKIKRNLSILMGIVFLLLFYTFAPADYKKGPELVLPNEVKNWSLDGKTEIYKGDDLFLYINGGAEIYHEYGFERVITGVYKNSASKTINAEIYEMKNSDAAYGIYSFKTSPGGKEVSFIDSHGKLQDYYLNIWKGKYKLTLVGFDQKEDTIQGLMDIGRGMLNNLPGAKSSLPKMTRELFRDSPLPNHVKYIRGELGLFNIYQFADTSLFHFEEGVVGFYDQYKLFIFKYQDEAGRRTIFLKLNNYFRNNNKVKFMEYQEGFIVIDKRKKAFFLFNQGDKIYIKLAKSYNVLMNVLKGMEL